MLINLQDLKNNIGPIFEVNNGTVIALVELCIQYSFETLQFILVEFILLKKWDLRIWSLTFRANMGKIFHVSHLIGVLLIFYLPLGACDGVLK